MSDVLLTPAYINTAPNLFGYVPCNFAHVSASECAGDEAVHSCSESGIVLLRDKTWQFSLNLDMAVDGT